MSIRDPHLIAADFVRDAGGMLVGRTRFQKVAYLTQLAGFSNDFKFEYRHYGPFSEDLAEGIQIASALGDLKEEIKIADWGGHYSVYSASTPIRDVLSPRSEFVLKAAKIGAIELELAATAAFLFKEDGVTSPWMETAKRKPEKAAQGRLERAKEAYNQLRNATGERLPELPAE